MEINEAELFLSGLRCSSQGNGVHGTSLQLTGSTSSDLCDPEHREQGYKLEKVTRVGLDLVQITLEGNFVPYKRLV